MIAEASATSSEVQVAINDIAKVQDEINIYLGQEIAQSTPIRDPSKMIEKSVEDTDSTGFEVFLTELK